MTNSKYLDYEKTLDEIITKIELSQLAQQHQENVDQAKFLKIFGLVSVASLPKAPSAATSATTSTNTTTTTITTIDSSKSLHLDDYVHPKPAKTVNLAEKLLVKLRKRMLNINHQFIVDLNRWKFIHSSDALLLAANSSIGTSSSSSSSGNSNSSANTNQFESKINLKPHVNLNRPLLIRSKKLKRNAQKFLLQSITTSKAASVATASLTTQSVAHAGNNNSSNSNKTASKVSNYSDSPLSTTGIYY